MLIADILHSCSDEGVASAAIASIGGLFAAAVRAEADREGMTVGALTTALVSSFARDASERDWRDLSLTMAGADLPLLSGLQIMAEHGLRRRARATRARPAREVVPAVGIGAPAVPFVFRWPA